VPRATTVLLAEEDGVGWDHPLSIEKLAPILALYTVKDWKEGCERCLEILRFGGAGHTLTIHSRNEEVIWEFAFEKPTHRILVNTPASHGAVGLSTWRAVDDPGLRRVRRQHHVGQHHGRAPPAREAARLREAGLRGGGAATARTREATATLAMKRPVPPSFSSAAAYKGGRYRPEAERGTAEVTDSNRRRAADSAGGRRTCSRSRSG
jgi:hypothetical protein